MERCVMQPKGLERIYLKFSGPCRLQNVASLARASRLCREEYLVAAWFNIFSAVSRDGHGALRQ